MISRRLAGLDGDFDALFRLDGLVDAVAPFAALRQPAGKLVDDHDLAVTDDILPIEMVFAIDQNRPLDVLVNVHHAHGVHLRRLGQQADLLAALARQLDGLFLVVVLIVLVVDELPDLRGAPFIALHRQALLFGRQGTDNQRRAGLVDKDAVGLVDQGEVGLALDRLFIRRPPAPCPTCRPAGPSALRQCVAAAAGRGESRNRTPWPCRT